MKKARDVLRLEWDMVGFRKLEINYKRYLQRSTRRGNLRLAKVVSRDQRGLRLMGSLLVVVVTTCQTGIGSK